MKDRVLFILHLPPPIHGASMVGQYIFESSVINEHYDCKYINYTSANSLKDIGGRGWDKLKRILQLYREVHRTTKSFKPDLVYISPNSKGGAFYIKDVPIVTYLKAKGIKVLAHYHNKGVAAYQDRWLDNLLYKRFFKGIKVILLANELYEDMKRYVDRTDLYICPNGIPGGSEFVLRANEVVPTILFLSNLLINKGVLTLLDALTILQKEGISFNCKLVGGETADFDTDSLLKEINTRGLEKRVSYLGRKDGEEKVEVFKSSDVFVLPSYDEAFPLVNLEAMSYHLPVVSTYVGGIPDAIKDGVNGLLCNARDVKGLKDCLKTLLIDVDLRKKMGEEGFEMYKSLYTKDAFIDRLDSIISELLHENE